MIFFRDKVSDEMKVTGAEREMGVKIGLHGKEARSLQRLEIKKITKNKNGQLQPKLGYKLRLTLHAIRRE